MVQLKYVGLKCIYVLRGWVNTVVVFYLARAVRKPGFMDVTHRTRNKWRPVKSDTDWCFWCDQCVVSWSVAQRWGTLTNIVMAKHLVLTKDHCKGESIEIRSTESQSQPPPLPLPLPRTPLRPISVSTVLRSPWDHVCCRVACTIFTCSSGVMGRVGWAH